MTRLKMLYIAGPYRASNAWAIEQNIRSAETVALQVWALGIVAVCPHTMTRFYQGALPDEIWLRGDLELLARCDGLLAIDRWEQSTGARIEVKYAQDKGIPVFVTVGEVEQAWCQEERGPMQVGLPGVV